MKVIKSLLLCFFIIIGCSTQTDNNEKANDSINNDGSSDITIKLSEYSKNYTFLQSDSKVKDHNFYWTTLIEKKLIC